MTRNNCTNRFDPKKLAKLNNPQRLEDIPVETVWSMLDLPANDTFVEIGAGTAFFSIAFLKKGMPRKLYACDVSETMIEWMTENVVPDHPEIHPIQTEEDAIPLSDGIADLVFMINLHHELNEPGHLLKESYRLLKPGGNVLIIDWKKEEMEEGPPLKIRCESNQVEELLKSVGFCEIKSANDLAKHFIVSGRKG